MTAVVGSRLGAILTDLGIAHPDDPRPVRRRRLLPDARARDPSSVITVMVEVDGADVGDLAAAGLRDISSGGAGAVLSGHIRVGFVVDLLAVDGVRSVEIESIGRPDIHGSVPAIHADVVRTGALGLTGEGVIVGVVDSGIDIFHQAFRKPDGSTRILSLLDLTAPYTLTAAGAPTGGDFRIGWIPPSGKPGAGEEQTTAALAFDATAQQVLAALGTIDAIEPGDVAVTGGPLPGSPIVVAFQGRYLHQDVNRLFISSSTITPATADITVVRGREYSEDEINDALAAPPNVFMSWDEEGHGSHVMGIAAGDGSQAGNCHLADYFVGVAPEADLVAVKTSFVDTQTLRGVNHVFTFADQRGADLGRHVPAVVNLSLTGSDGGARDGTTPLEKAIDALLAADPPGRVIVKSAGNYGRAHDYDATPQVYWTGSASHSRKTVPPNDEATMTAVVRSGDLRDDRFDFWYKGTGRLSITIESPVDDTTVGPVAAGAGTETLDLHDHSILVNNRTDVEPGSHNIFVRISPPDDERIRKGEWIFTLTETAGTEVEVHCWIEVEKTDAHPRFSDDDQDRQFTLTPPGTAHRIISVANYDHRDDTLYEGSSRGPTTDVRTGNDTKPDVAAPGVGIMAARSGSRNNGVCCDCCTDFYTAKTGTSMAAPHVTGVIALMLQRNHTLTWQEVRDHLRSTADPPDPVTGPTLPDATWGAGIVNAEAAVEAVPEVSASGASPIVAGDGFLTARRFVARRRAQAFDELRAAVLRTAEGQLGFALVSTHLNEAIRLVNTDRRVTVAWHRMGGPELLTAALDGPRDPVEEVRAILGGAEGPARLERFLDALATAGSPRLQADIARHRPFLLALPTLDLTGTDPIDAAG